MRPTRIARSKLFIVAVGLATAGITGCGQQGDDQPGAAEVVRAQLQIADAAIASAPAARPHHYSGRSPDGVSHGLAETSSQHLNFFGMAPVGGCQPSHLVLHGGQPMQGPTDGAPVKIVPVIWSGASSFGFTTAQIDDFIGNAFNSPWWSWIRREYHLANVTKTGWSTLTLSAADAAKTVISDADIQAEILANLKGNTLPMYGGGSTVGSMIYVIHVPPTISIIPPNEDINTQVCGGADNKHTKDPVGCAYNVSLPGYTWTDGQQIKYVVMPDQTKGPCFTFCANTQISALDNQTLAESHELIEGMSDPWTQTDRSVHGWYDTNGCGQMADMCDGFPATTVGSGPTVVQMIWSNAANRCVNNSPGALGDINSMGTSAILLSGDTDPGATSAKVHIAQAGFGDLQFTALQPLDLTLALTGAPGWITSEKTGKPVMGDFTGDGVADLALTGAAWPDLPASIIPVLRSDAQGDLTRPGGGMSIVEIPPELNGKTGADFPTLASQTSIPPVTGDFNGDGFADIAVVGGSGWTTIPLALSTHDGLGQFWGTNEFDSGFNSYITNNVGQAPQLVSADFNGDGLSDLAFVGLQSSPGVGRDYIAVALAAPDQGHNYRGNATFVVRSWALTAPTGGSTTDFNTWAASPGVKAVAGDFDGDGFGDIALAGGQGWASIPMAFSRGAVNGPTTFQTVNAGGTDNATFASKASATGAEIVAGDFDGNGTSDLAVTGASSFNFVGLALGPDAPTTPGSMIWVSDSSNLAAFAKMAAQVNVVATAPSRGGPLAFVIPPTPTGLSATVAPGQLTMRWNPSGGALTYTLFRSTTAGAEAPIASGLTATSYVDSGLPATTKFYYKVGAVNVQGTSSLSAEVSATTPTAPPSTTSLNCGGSATGTWSADTTTTGSTKTWANAVNTSLLTGTIPPQTVLQSGRVGNLTYNFTGYAANSSHNVTLYFVENYWGSTGSRLFTVKANGTAKLTSFDIFGAAGAKFKAVQRAFTATADASGKIALTFVPSKDNASVEGIIVQ